MPLPLSDLRWNQLRSAYDGTEDIIAWLTDAYREGLSEERLGDLINEISHQGGTSEAMYAVAPHLIAIARHSLPENALSILTQAGMIYAVADIRNVAPCPQFLQEEFAAAADEGAKMLSLLLPLAKDFDSYNGAVAGLAGFLGQRSFARFLNGLDYYEGKFYHRLLDAPFPSED